MCKSSVQMNESTEQINDMQIENSDENWNKRVNCMQISVQMYE